MSSSVAPYGSWESPITTELIVSSSVSLGEVWVDGDDVWWSELRPEEGGRVALCRCHRAGEATDVLDDAWSARTRVHEYGGGAWWLHTSTVFFANWDDQRLYRLTPESQGPVPITRDPAVPHGLRYADGRVSPDGRWVVCVRESHEAEGEAINEIVAVPASGGDATALVSGADFVSSPRISADGTALCWLQWNHPNMPWDGTELWVARLEPGTDDITLAGPRCVAGGPDESVFQPEWGPDGVLHFISDRDEWWTIHRFASPGLPERGDQGEPIVVEPAEIGGPQWVFGLSQYCFIDDGSIVAAATHDGLDELWCIQRPQRRSTRLDVPFTAISYLKAQSGGVLCVAASSTTEPAIVGIELRAAGDHPEVVQLRPPRELGLDPATFSTPRAITFPTTDAVEAYGLYYPPTNPRFSGPSDELPPLVVSIHGGPTSKARPQLQLGVQFWTSRGFGVVDVNYRGSTGFGRTYRRLLDEAWGVADVEDCAAAARWLAQQGEVDQARLVIHGGSAGGFTTLAALTLTDTFAAGTSSYGVADLEALARDTHKFESRYLDSLIGPYPAQRDLYIERSPIHHTDLLDTPLLVLQGLEDEIVPPSQAEMMVEALRARRVPFAYLTFDGEQHGWRRAATIQRALDAELFFYARVLGFDPSGDVEPIEIENL